jgi:hypothetical protein
MSITLSLEFDGGVDCPFWFEHSDSKCLVDFCSEVDRGLLEGRSVLPHLPTSREPGCS